MPRTKKKDLYKLTAEGAQQRIAYFPDDVRVKGALADMSQQQLKKLYDYGQQFKDKFIQKEGE